MNGADLSEAIVIYLRHYPGRNETEFEARYGDESPTVRRCVREVLAEATQVEIDWSQKALADAAIVVESSIAERYPGLSPDALSAIGNYFTYLMR
jgi:hypothetical protein